MLCSKFCNCGHLTLGEDSDSEQETEIIIRKRFPKMKNHEKKKTINDFPWLCCTSSIFCFFGGITFAVASHKVMKELSRLANWFHVRA